MGLDDLDERLDGEGVVLTGDRELRQTHGLPRVLRLDARGVLEDLTGGGEKLLAFTRHGHTTAGS